MTLASVIVSVRIIFLPSPGILAHVMHIILCFPAKILFRFGSRAVAGRYITFTSLVDDVRDRYPVCILKILYDIKDAVTNTCSEVVY